MKPVQELWGNNSRLLKQDYISTENKNKGINIGLTLCLAFVWVLLILMMCMKVQSAEDESHLKCKVQSNLLVHSVGIKSDMNLVRVGLCQGCRVSRYNHVMEGSHFCSCKWSSSLSVQWPPAWTGAVCSTVRSWEWELASPSQKNSSGMSYCPEYFSSERKVELEIDKPSAVIQIL